MTALVGDIGGTNARFAVWRDQQIESVRVLPTIDYPRPEDAIRAYLQGVGQSVEALQAVCLACAGPAAYLGGDMARRRRGFIPCPVPDRLRQRQ